MSSTDRRTDRRTDGQGESSIPPGPTKYTPPPSSLGGGMIILPDWSCTQNLHTTSTSFWENTNITLKNENIWYIRYFKSTSHIDYITCPNISIYMLPMMSSCCSVDNIYSFGPLYSAFFVPFTSYFICIAYRLSSHYTHIFSCQLYKSCLYLAWHRSGLVSYQCLGKFCAIVICD